MSRKIYFTSKAGILLGALFFLSAQLFAQDTLRSSINASHKFPDSTLIVKKKQVVRANRHADSLMMIDSSGTTRALKKKWIPQPERATILSAVLPGLGQVYNRKYWKVPIIYATGGVLYYLYFINDTAFVNTKRLYDEEIAKGDLMNVEAKNKYKLNYEEYNKKREYKLILLGVLYVANIVDAMADAYFATYDISDDLAFKIRPTLLPLPNFTSLDLSYGIKLSLYF